MDTRERKGEGRGGEGRKPVGVMQRIPVNNILE